MPRLSQTQKNYYEQWNKADAQLKLTHKLEMETQQQNSLSDYKNQLELMTNTMLESSVAPLKEQIKQQQKEIEKLKWQLGLTANEIERLDKSKTLLWMVEEKSRATRITILVIASTFFILLVGATLLMMALKWAYEKILPMINPTWFFLGLVAILALVLVWLFRRKHDEQY